MYLKVKVGGLWPLQRVLRLASTRQCFRQSHSLLPCKPLPETGHQCRIIGLFLVSLLWIDRTDAGTLCFWPHTLCVILIIVDKLIKISAVHCGCSQFVNWCVLWYACICMCRCQSLASLTPAGGLHLIQMNSLLFFKGVRLATNKSPCFYSFNWNSFRRLGDYTNMLTGWSGCWQISPK